jgi:ribosomal protein S18 acetylase RimI-like enzyme
VKETSIVLPQDYQLQPGFAGDKALLLKFLYLTYSELFPQQEDFSHLNKTVDSYFSASTPLWWVYSSQEKAKIACLWLGNAIDQVTGERYSHIFLVYVKPNHRRQGLAKCLLNQAKFYAESRGDRQIGLQVYPHNQAALNLYKSLGYDVHSLLMLKKF